MKTETKCVHSGGIKDKVSGGVNSPIFTSSANDYLGREGVPYPRYFNILNQQAVEEKLSALENSEAGLIFSSGMAAITTTLMTFLQSGDHAVLQDEIYGGSHAFIENHLDRLGISYTFVGTSSNEFVNAINDKTKLVYMETPTNPLLSIVDIEEIAALARNRGCLSIIDGTFATPILQKPIELGVDIVVHSGTKYFGGHSDLCCGAVLASLDLIENIKKTAICYGGSLNAMACYQLERSLKTLAIRMERQNENAQTIAEFLHQQSSVSKVHYPGIIDHPGHEIAKKQMKGFGAMLSFVPADKKIQAIDFLKRLHLIKPAVSLGGVETTICDPATTSHAKVSGEVRKRLGIADNLLRLSVGIESVDDLISDLKQALG